MHKRYGSGYSLVELAIVVAVLAILAAIIYVSYSSYTDHGRATATMANLENLDKAFRQWALEERMYQWESQSIPSGGLSIDDMRETFPSLAHYIIESPKIDGLQSEDWFYDNDNDTKTECGDHYQGVNIVIRYVTNEKVALLIDEGMDDGNFTCGKIRYVDQRVFYSLSYGQDTDI